MQKNNPNLGATCNSYFEHNEHGTAYITLGKIEIDANVICTVTNGEI